MLIQAEQFLKGDSMMNFDALTFDTGLRPGEDKRIREIAESVELFYPDEVDVAEELAIYNIEKGAETSGYNFLLCRNKSRIIGYTCFGEIPCTKNRYDLYWIIVDNSYKRAGIGKKLLAATEKLIAGMGGKKLYIETSSREPYIGTRDFYVSCGYTTEAVFNDFYDDGDNKIVYVKDLL